MTRGGVLLAASLVGPGDFAFGAAVTAVGFAGAAAGGCGSDPRRPTERDSLLKKPSEELALAFADAAGVVLVTATIGSLLDAVKLNDGTAGSGAFGIVACAGTVPGAGPLDATA